MCTEVLRPSPKPFQIFPMSAKKKHCHILAELIKSVHRKAARELQ